MSIITISCLCEKTGPVRAIKLHKSHLRNSKSFRMRHENRGKIYNLNQYLTISQDQKGLLQFELGHCVADFSQKLLAYVIVQNYTPGGVSSNLNDFGNSGNFEFSRSELYRNSRTASGDSLCSRRNGR
jgi:hypothetical protein